MDTQRTLNGAERQAWSRLFDWQMWCLGQDITAEHNLLTEFGFARTPRPAGQPGFTCYQRHCSPQATLWLWAFGIAVGAPQWGGALFVDRQAASLTWVEPAPLVPPSTAQALEVSACPGPVEPRRLCLGLFHMATGLRDYEAWVHHRQGAAYRAQQFLMRRRRCPHAEQGLSAAWGEWIEWAKVRLDAEARAGGVHG